MGIDKGHKMYTQFFKCEDSRELYFKLSNSFNINLFNQSSKTLKHAGLYAIYNGDICVYVGQSQNLASRITQHLTGRYCNATRIHIFLAEFGGSVDFYSLGKRERKLLIEYNEWLLMEKLKPTENLKTLKQIEFEDSLPKFISTCDPEIINDGEIISCDMSIYIDDIMISTCESLELDPTIATEPQYASRELLLESAEHYGLDFAKKHIKGF